MITCAVCAGQARRAKGTDAPTIRKFVVKLEQTECYGRCPSYRITLEGSGRLTFEGISNVRRIGKVVQAVSTADLRDLVRVIRSLRYFELRDTYINEADGCTSMSSDASSVLTSLQISGKRKDIRHYLGCVYGTKRFNLELARLTQIENAVRDLVPEALLPTTIQ